MQLQSDSELLFSIPSELRGALHCDIMVRCVGHLLATRGYGTNLVCAGKGKSSQLVARPPNPRFFLTVHFGRSRLVVKGDRT